MSYTPIDLKKINNKLKQKKTAITIFGIGSIVLILVVLGLYSLTIFKKPIVTKKKAWFDTNNVVTYDCRGWKLVFKAVSDVDCHDVATNNYCRQNQSSNPLNSVKTYSTKYLMQAVNNSQTSEKVVITTNHENRPDLIEFNVTKNSNFCTEGCGKDYPDTCNSCCLENPEQPTENVKLTKENDWSKEVTITRTSPGPADKICGSFQTDLWMKDMVNQNEICPGVDFSKIRLAFGLCLTGATCVEPSPTPETSPSPTPTNTPTPTLTPNPTVTLTPTPTPTSTPVPTETPHPNCNENCANNAQCPTDHVCSGGKCILALCIQSGVTCDANRCYVITPTNTPTPTEIILAKVTNTPGPTTPKASPSLPEAGGYGRWPFIIVPAFVIALGLLL